MFEEKRGGGAPGVCLLFARAPAKPPESILQPWRLRSLRQRVHGLSGRVHGFSGWRSTGEPPSKFHDDVLLGDPRSKPVVNPNEIVSSLVVKARYRKAILNLPRQRCFLSRIFSCPEERWSPSLGNRPGSQEQSDWLPNSQRLRLGITESGPSSNPSGTDHSFSWARCCLGLGIPTNLNRHLPGMSLSNQRTLYPGKCV